MVPIEKNLDKFSTKFLSKRFIFAMDMLLSLLASVIVAIIAYLLQITFFDSRSFILIYGCSSVIASFVMFLVCKTYSIIIRHFTIKDILVFAVASFGKVLLMFALLCIFGRYEVQLIPILIIDACLSLVFFCIVRALMVSVYDSYKYKVREIQKCMRVLVYGISDKSIATVTRLRGSKHYQVLGFLSHDKHIKDSMLLDKSVYSFDDEASFDAIARMLSVSGVIFAKDGDAQAEQDNLVKYCTELGIKVFIVPIIDEVSGSQIPAKMSLREVKIEDLLGRDEIKISLDSIRAVFKDKVVMVTGAAGSIGSELCRQLANFGIRQLVLFDNAETPMHNLRLEFDESYPHLQYIPVIGDVRQKERLDFVFRTFHPQIVFHAAAYKHVPLMEENPCEAVLVNVYGTRNVADKCIQYGVEKMVMISTDKAVNPTSVMGCTKRLAEIYVQSLGQAISEGSISGGTRFVTTRFGNVLGSNGSVIPHFRDQIANGGPVTVTHKDITRYFMTIPEACRLVMEAVSLHTENSICVFDMGKPVKIDTLARRMIQLSGLEPDKDIDIVYTGLRPGEKLYEEVLSNVENTDPTTHDRIRIAHVRQYDYSSAIEVVDNLEKLSRSVDIPDMIKYMKKIVPEYVSNNSLFEAYDQKTAE